VTPVAAAAGVALLAWFGWQCHRVVVILDLLFLVAACAVIGVVRLLELF
jgi:hypothetical protein